MKKKLTTVEFHGTKEQEEKLLDIIAKYKDTKGAMMQSIARETGKPIEEIFGIATFYSQFSLNPKGAVSIAVCLGTACYVKGSGDLYNKLGEVLGLEGGGTSSDGKFSLEATRCIGACGLAPVLTVNGNVYGRLTTADIEGIIAEYR